jgi:hypothetical protein
MILSSLDCVLFSESPILYSITLPLSGIPILVELVLSQRYFLPYHQTVLFTEIYPHWSLMSPSLWIITWSSVLQQLPYFLRECLIAVLTVKSSSYKDKVILFWVLQICINVFFSSHDLLLYWWPSHHFVIIITTMYILPLLDSRLHLSFILPQMILTNYNYDEKSLWTSDLLITPHTYVTQELLALYTETLILGCLSAIWTNKRWSRSLWPFIMHVTHTTQS